MKMEQTGSAIIQPNICIRIAETEIFVSVNAGQSTGVLVLTNNSQRAESVGQDVKEDTLHDLTASPASSTVTVAVTSIMAVSVSPVMRVAVPRPAVLEHEDPHQVDEEPENGNHQQPLVLHLGRLHQPLHGLAEDEEGDEEEKQSVDEARQCLRPDVS